MSKSPQIKNFLSHVRTEDEDDLDGYRYPIQCLVNEDNFQIPHSRKHTEFVRESKESLNKMTDSFLNQASSKADTRDEFI